MEKIKGIDENFFYEYQLYNKATSWELLNPGAGNFGAKDARGETTHNTGTSIIRGILADTEINISIENNFTNASGGLFGVASTIVNKINDASSTVAVGSGAFNDLISDAKSGKFGNKVKSGVTNLGNKIKTGFDEFNEGMLSKIEDEGTRNTINNLTKTVKDKIGGQLVSTFDYVKVFKGTTLNIGIPSLDTRIYSGVPVVGDKLTVKESIKALNKIFMGTFSTVGDSTLEQVLGLQSPPNGYLPTFKNIDALDTYIKGTFILRYGRYEIPNLLVTGLSYRLSVFKNIVNPNDILFADISIQVLPATYISKQLIDKIIDRACDVQTK